MKKNEFNNQLKKRLHKLSEDEQNSLIEYFDELIDDKMQNENIDEDAAVKSLGNIDDIAEYCCDEIPSDKEKKNYSKNDYDTIFNESGDIKTICEKKEVHSLLLDITSDSVELIKSIDGIFNIEYLDSDKCEYEYSYNDGKVIFEQKPKFFLKRFFNFSFEKPPILIYIPEGLDGTIELKTKSGSITNKNCPIDAEKLIITILSGEINLNNVNISDKTEVSVASGDVFLTNAIFDKLTTHIASGDGKFNSIKVKDELIIEVSSGDMTVNSVTAENLAIKVISGDLNANNLVVNSTSEISIVSGDIAIKDFSFKNLKSKAVSGDIKYKINGKIEDYTINGKMISGECKLSGTNINLKNTRSFSYGTGEKKIEVTATSGDTEIFFD